MASLLRAFGFIAATLMFGLFHSTSAHANESMCGNGMECYGAQGLPTVVWATTVSCSRADKPLPPVTQIYPPWVIAPPPATGFLNSTAATADAMDWWTCLLREYDFIFEGKTVCDPGGAFPNGAPVVDAYWSNGSIARTKQPMVIRYKALVGPPGSQTCDQEHETAFDLLAQNGAYCPATIPGYLYSIGNAWICHRPTGCADPLKCGNPVSMEGEKTQVEQDYRGAGMFPLELKRQWSSYAMSGAPGEHHMDVFHPIGNAWRTAYHRRAFRMTTPNVDMTTLVRDTGRNLHFQLQAGVWKTPIGSTGKLETILNGAAFDGWRYTTPENEIEVYNAAGKLVSITSAAGQVQTVSYDVSGRLDVVTDPQGRQLVFSYGTDNRVSSVTTPDGMVSYTYDGFGNLATASFPDGRTRTYHYELSATRYSMTGVTDENGVRLSTFGYNASTGLATSTELAGGVQKYTVAWNSPYSTITDPLGTQRTITTALNSTAKKQVITQITEPNVSGSGNQNEYRSYDANGNISQRTDFNGNVTNYVHDLTRNLETKRTEVATIVGSCPAGVTYYSSNYGQAQCTAGTCWSTSPFAGSQSAAALGYPSWQYACAGLTSGPRSRWTEWLAARDVPKRIAEPKRLTTFAYHGESGVSCAPSGASNTLLCSRSVQATTDPFATSGFSATTTGSTRTWANTYNAAGQVLTINGPRTDVSDVTTFAYYGSNDPSGNYRAGDLMSVTNALSHVTDYTHYDATGRLKRMVDPNGLATELEYWPRGWLKSRRLLKASEVDELTQYEYDYAGQLTKVIQPDASWIRFMYDAAHRLIGIDDNLGNAIDYTLDNMGNRKEEKTYDPADTLKGKVKREFNAWNRLWKDIAANDSAVTYTYDGVGNLKTITQPTSLARPVTTNLYDTWSRLTQVTDADAAVVKYEYDALDQLTKVTDPRNLATTYALDGLGNQASLVSPDTGTTTFSSYDEAGNLKTATDARSKTVNYTYDALNRVAGAVYADQTIAYTYDQGTNGKGRLTRIVDATGQTDFTYDAAGRLKTDTRAVGAVTMSMAYGYDASGRLSSVTYPSGRQVTYGFDGAGRIASASVTASGTTTSLVTGATYQPFGGLTGFTFAGSSATYARGYDLNGRVSSYKLGTATFNLTYDDAGSITRISDPANTTIDRVYTYDKVDRLLTFVTSPTALNETFTYDKTGNRLTRVVNGSSITNTIQSTSNRLTALGGVTRSYDTAGSLTADGVNTFTYDDRGRLTGAVTGLGSVTYALNGLGQRVKKVVGTTATLFAYDSQGHIVGEYDGTGAAIRETVWIGDTPVSVLVGSPTFTAFDIWTDHLNTPRLVTNAANQKRWEWSQEDAFGDNVPNDNPASLGAFAFNLRFPGQYFDAETGTHYNYFRDYDPRIGRYVESDPIGLRGGINTYGYVTANPLRFSDPRGLESSVDGGRQPIGLPDPGGEARRRLAQQLTDLLCQIRDKLSGDKKCPPCKLMDGTIVSLGTIGYRRLDTPPDGKVEHGIAGSHHNIYRANQNPNDCQCFWQPLGAVPPPPEPNWIPIQPFMN